MGLVDFPTRKIRDQHGRSDYVVAPERIYGLDRHGDHCLLYPVGALVPIDEAVRLGLVDEAEPEDDPVGELEGDLDEPEAKAVEPAEVEDKAVKEPAETKRRARKTEPKE